MAIEKLDLNLFKVFEAVLRHRGVSGAARELHVTASAVSHALARLRQAIGDELFVPGESGMEPTPRARELAPGVRDGLERISLAVNARPFVASESARTFRFAASDHTATTILPPPVRRIVRDAPNINPRLLPPILRGVTQTGRHSSSNFSGTSISAPGESFSARAPAAKAIR